MFVCEICKNKMKNIISSLLPMSFGRCEMCGNAEECYDIKSQLN